MVNQDWVEWNDLKELGVKDFQFFDYLRAGLQPYEKHNKKTILCCLDEHEQHHAYRHKLNRFDEIEILLNSFTDLADLENKVEETKPYTFYVKRVSLFVDDYFSKHPNNIFLRPIANKGYPINSKIIQKLKTYKDELTKEKSEIENKLEGIVKDDSDLHSWRYFVLPSDEECEKIKSDLIERAVFKKDAALNIKNSFNSATEIDTELLIKSMAEINILYNAMKKDVSFSGRITDLETKLKEKAKETFKKPNNSFKLIKIQDIDDRDIYALDPGQSRRDFAGALLKKIVKRETGITVGGQKLFKRYIALKNSTNSTNILLSRYR